MCLYVVATPIGNLEDITLRALRILKEVDLIASEDTRLTRKLTSRYGINTPLRSYYQYNRFKEADKLLELLESGKKIALVTNAGTPGISDPGSHLIRLAIKMGIRVIPVPGASALTACFSVSGFQGTNFIFYGWLSPKSSRRFKELESLKDEPRTIIFYEAPHRILASLIDMREVLGDRFIVIGRELTKKFEELLRAKLSELIDFFSKTKPRGEFTLILSPKDKGYS